MRRKRKRRIPPGVSLFPFLAVLICTLGVLIVMLVIAVKAADNSAGQVAAEEQEAFDKRRTQLLSDLETEQFRVDGLEMLRPDVLERLSGIRALRGHLKNEISDLQSDTEQLIAQITAAQQRKLEADQERSQQIQQQIVRDNEVKQLRDDLELAQLLLEEEQKLRVESAPVVYSIVPTDSPDGSGRRPIYIECTAAGVIIQPFGIYLDADDLREPYPPGNPLDAALLAIRDYLQEFGPARSDESPYPLLVVRPDGAQAYTAARRAMKSWDDEFGYELIDDGLVLDYGEPDQQLENEVISTVEKARVRQQYLVTASQRASGAMPGGRPNSESGGLVVSGRHGGFVNSDGSRPSSSTRQASADSRDARRGSFDSNVRTAGQTAAGGSPQRGSASGASGSGDVAGNVGGVDGNTDFMASRDMSAESGQANGQSDCNCLADSRGEQWALPTRTPGATPYVRPVRIICSSSSLTIRSAGQRDIELPFNGKTENAVEPLVDSIWRMIESWGPAGNDAYWKPQLRVTVLAGGQQRLTDLNRLLARSGIGIQEEQQ